MTTRLDLPHVTRIEVIDSTGRAFARHYDTAGATVLVQDDGRTVKVLPDVMTQNAPAAFPSRAQLLEVIVEAVAVGTKLQEDPEFGGSVEDIIADKLFARFATQEA